MLNINSSSSTGHEEKKLFELSKYFTTILYTRYARANMSLEYTPESGDQTILLGIRIFLFVRPFERKGKCLQFGVATCGLPYCIKPKTITRN